MNLNVPGVNRSDGDFALAWTRSFGSGRLFYAPLGHRGEVWQDGRFQQHLLNEHPLDYARCAVRAD
jgi:uncharacterized protein